jgi:hypothetical protein
MLRNHWYIGLAVLMLGVAPAMGEEAEKKAEKPQSLNVQRSLDVDRADLERVRQRIQSQVQLRGPSTYALIADPSSGTGAAMPVGQYWLGIYCAPVPAELRAQLSLPEKQGVLVMGVSKDSPAMKAGFVQHDILLRAGGKPLTEPRDLVTAIEAAKETKLKIELLRGGKPKTIEATPAKRPVEMGTPPVGDQADWDTVQRWLDQMNTPGQSGIVARGPIQFRYFHPGAIVPDNLFAKKPLPKNMSITIVKQGDEPAKITVKRDDKTWEVTEKELDKLPADVRPHVDAMLGRTVLGTPVPFSGNVMFGPRATPGSGVQPGATFNMPVPPAMNWPQPFSGGLEARIEKRFEEMNQRMDKLMQMMERMSEGRAPEAAPQGQDQPEK